MENYYNLLLVQLENYFTFDFDFFFFGASLLVFIGGPAAAAGGGVGLFLASNGSPIEQHISDCAIRVFPVYTVVFECQRVIVTVIAIVTTIL